MPSEHGGWGLTAESVILGLLVAPSVAGVALGFAALIAFVARTPIMVVLVDRWRHRRLPRTRLAARVGSTELLVLGALVALVALRSGREWWAPLVAAGPLVAVEVWFDMLSRSRRLVPELCGAVGVSSVAAAIARAGGTGWSVAIGLWVVLAARSIACIPFARAQVQRIKGHAARRWGSDLAQAAALAVIITGWAVGTVPLAAVAAVAVVGALQLCWLRRPPPAVIVLGVTQLFIGVAVVLTAAAAIRLA
ncbi:MAG: YwiC-like family protein [Acidimicrobiales bacterium]